MKIYATHVDNVALNIAQGAGKLIEESRDIQPVRNQIRKYTSSSSTYGLPRIKEIKSQQPIRHHNPKNLVTHKEDSNM